MIYFVMYSGPVEPIPAMLKRKRVENGVESDETPTPGPNKSRNPTASLEERFSNPESKKARKRRRKLERQALEAEVQSKLHTRANGMNTILPLSPPTPVLQAWLGATFDPYPFHNTPQQDLDFTSTINRRPHQQLHQDNISALQYPTHRYSSHHRHDNNFTDSSIASTSTWVSSMTMAAHPLQDANQSNVYSNTSHWPLPPKPVPAPTDILNASEAQSIHSHATLPVGPRGADWSTKVIPMRPVASLPPRPKKSLPPPSQIIGMQPDQDPYSKHGIFHLAASSQPQSSDGKGPYMPNPARTLVMEQLPKSHRTHDFVNSWSKSACRAYPVYVAVDVAAAKALVEFATAKLARKAWGSPKLSAGVAGLKPQQLKGKPREDLIRVWWYRVDGVGAGGGVCEIEEGEIEGDAGEREVSVPLKKETKKERKARMAKEREAKLIAERADTGIRDGNAVQQQFQSEAQVNPPHPTLHLFAPQVNVPTTAPATTSSNRNVYAGPSSYSEANQYQPQRQNHHRAPLPSQSELGTQWRGPDGTHDPYRKPQPPIYGGQDSPTRNGSFNVSDDHDSIASSRRARSVASSRHVSIASSRSNSPIAMSVDAVVLPLVPPHRALPPITVPRPPAVSDIVDDNKRFSDDMEVDLDTDMDLDTPAGATFSFKSVGSRQTVIPNPALVSQQHASSMVKPSVPPLSTLTLSAPVPKLGQPPPPPLGHGHLASRFTVSPAPTMALPTPTPTPPFISAPTPSFASKSLSISTPPLAASPTPSNTPLSTPSEPRAMKNAPKGPSFAKRSLLARKKELEERIAMSKLALGQPVESKGLSTPVEDTGTPGRCDSVISSATGSVSASPVSAEMVNQNESAADKIGMENKLRRLVLESQRNKGKPVHDAGAESLAPTAVSNSASPSPLLSTSVSSSTSTATPSPLPSLPSVATAATTSSTVSTTPGFSLDDLAVSFITETIQTLKPGPRVPPRPESLQATTKVELAAKQKRLEQQIAESKVLMAKLTQARTKQEKDSIFAAMRESRCVSVLLWFIAVREDCKMANEYGFGVLFTV